MVIGPDDRWIYLGPPKTGSTAFTELLQSPPFHGRSTGHQHDTTLPAGFAGMVLASVRNPYPRAVSLYQHFLNEGMPDRPLAETSDYSFASFVARHLLGREHADPFFWGTVSWWLRFIRQGVRVLHLERAADELAALRLVPGIHVLPLRNSSGRGPWAGYYDEGTITGVREWAAGDFAAFGYHDVFPGSPVILHDRRRQRRR